MGGKKRTDAKVAKARKLREEGLLYREIGDILGVHRETIRYWLDPSARQHIAQYRTKYRQENKEKIKQHNAEYYQENKEKILQYQAKYRRENPEKHRQRHAKYCQENPGKEKQRHAKYYREHKEERAQYAVEYRRENLEKAKQREAKYRRENKEKIARYGAEYYQEHKEEAAQRGAKRYQEHKEEILQQHAKYYREHPEKGRQHAAKRRALKTETSVDLSTEQIEEINEIYRKAQKGSKVRCYLCGKLIPKGHRHVDHIVPLSKGGKHVPSNLAIAYDTYNLSKGAKLPEEVGILV